MNSHFSIAARRTHFGRIAGALVGGLLLAVSAVPTAFGAAADRPAPTVIGFRLKGQTPVTPPFPSGKGPKVSILGDSYSTFEGWLPEGNVSWYTGVRSGTHYSETDCHNVSNTWWHQVVLKLDATLLVNESYSGTLFSNYQPPAPLAPRGPSFLTRTEKLSRDGNDPDLIFIFGGTNDRFLNVSLGSLVWSDWTEAQLMTFAPAVAKTFCQIEKRYPKARKIVIINTGLGDYYESSNTFADTGRYADILKNAAAHMGWETVALKDIVKHSEHPKIEGHNAIAEQVLAVVNSPVTPPAPASSLKVSILGDSYSTYLGYLPAGQATWYGDPKNEHWYKTDVHSVSNTWWHQLTQLIDARILVNNSWSGTTIGNYGYNGADMSGRSFLSRVHKLHSETEQPDVIVVLGGTNDGWAGAPEGSWKWSGWTDSDLRTFKPAVAKLFTDLQENYPQARKVVVVNDYLLSMNSGYATKLNALVSAVDTMNSKAPGLWSSVRVDITGHEGGSHPDSAGMTIIAKAVAQAISGGEPEPAGPKANAITGLKITGWTVGAYDQAKNGPSISGATHGADKVYYLFYRDSECSVHVNKAAAAIEAGTYWVKAVIDGDDEYATATAVAGPFTIAAQTEEHAAGAYYDLKNAYITFYDPDAAIYTGSPVTPAVIVTVVADGVESRLPYSAYTLTYANNTAVGTASVTATGKGDFCNSCTATFSIVADTAQDLAKGADGRYAKCDYANVMTTLSHRLDDPTSYRKYAVLGDSFSSWDPRGPLNASGCPYYYPNEDVLFSMSRMWHGYVATMNGSWKCCENSSFSGGCAALLNGEEYRAATDANGKVMYGEAANRMTDFGKGADIIFVFLGINDSAKVPLGAYTFRNWSNDDIKSFRGAYAYCLKMMRRNNPSARIVCLTYGNLDFQQGYPGGAAAQSVQYIARRMGVECLNLPILRLGNVPGSFVDDLYHHTYSEDEISALTGLNIVWLNGARNLQNIELGPMGHPENIGMYKYATYITNYLRGKIGPNNGVMNDTMDSVDPDAPHAGYTVGTITKWGGSGSYTVYRGIVSREIADCENWTISASLSAEAPFTVAVALNANTRVLPSGGSGRTLVTLQPGKSMTFDSRTDATWMTSWTADQAKVIALRAYSYLQFVAIPPTATEADKNAVPSFADMKKYLTFTIKKL